MIKQVITIICLLQISTALASEWTGKIISISDGDTLSALTSNKQQVKIRLLEIDAPESDESFGNKSRQSLAQICFKKPAVIREKGKDRYGRTLARVLCDGVDANAEQVRRGMAWAFVKYLTDPEIAELEITARNKRIGLWSETNPIPPWEFRDAKRHKYDSLVSSPPLKPAQVYPESETFSCEGKNSYCKSMRSCAEAKFYLEQCGAKKLDRDGDGIPCENICK